MEGDQTIVLKDNRRLGFREFGERGGIPIFHFHAAGSSRLERPANADILKKLGVRFITSDRPGHGLSDFQKGRKLLDWPADVKQLAKSLRIDRFYVMGYSNGGPNALVCATSLPERVVAGAVVSCPSPRDCPGAMDGIAVAESIAE